MHIHYLKQHNVKNTQNLHKLIYQREESSIKNNVDTYFFHFHPDDTINIENDFDSLRLPKEWGKGKKLHNKIYKELKEYLDHKTYDPLAICFALRKIIEKKVYDKISNDIQKKRVFGQEWYKGKIKFCLFNRH